MRLGIQMLDSNSSLNNLMYKNQAFIVPGETATIMFQLMDLDQNQRYIPSNIATVNCTISSINSANSLSKVASSAFAQDGSVWSFNLSTTETQTMAGVNMTVKLTDGAAVKIARAEAVIIVAPQSQYSC